MEISLFLTFSCEFWPKREIEFHDKLIEDILKWKPDSKLKVIAKKTALVIQILGQGQIFFRVCECAHQKSY